MKCFLFLFFFLYFFWGGLGVGGGLCPAPVRFRHQTLVIPLLDDFYDARLMKSQHLWAASTLSEPGLQVVAAELKIRAHFKGTACVVPGHFPKSLLRAVDDNAWTPPHPTPPTHLPTRPHPPALLLARGACGVTLIILPPHQA